MTITSTAPRRRRSSATTPSPGPSAPPPQNQVPPAGTLLGGMLSLKQHRSGGCFPVQQRKHSPFNQLSTLQITIRGFLVSFKDHSSRKSKKQKKKSKKRRRRSVSLAQPGACVEGSWQGSDHELLFPQNTPEKEGEPEKEKSRKDKENDKERERESERAEVRHKSPKRSGKKEKVSRAGEEESQQRCESPRSPWEDLELGFNRGGLGLGFG